MTRIGLRVVLITGALLGCPVALLSQGRQATLLPYEGPVISVSYLDFSKPGIPKVRSKMQHLKRVKAGLPNCTEAPMISEVGTPARFVAIDSWSSVQAQKEFAQSDDGLAKVDWEGQGALAPPDMRLHRPYNVAPARPAGRDGVYVITHVDVGPPNLAALEVLLKQLTDLSRQEPANLRFDVLQSTTRPNHFTLLELWNSNSGADAHATAVHTIAFREKLSPLLGALYDQRVYTELE
jgi:quinol monooxygenase YgiN